MPDDAPKALGDVLHNVIERLGIRKELDEARAIETWAALAGPRVNGVTDKAWIRHGTLFVKIRSATWRHELHLQRRAWCDRLNEQLGERLIDEIVFR